MIVGGTQQYGWHPQTILRNAGQRRGCQPQVRLRRRSLRRVHGMPMLWVLRDLLGMSGDASTV
jgi:hypothetical protein